VLLDDAHVFSLRANEWLDAQDRRIATCPIVETDDGSVLDEAAIDVSRLHGHRQITDACLLPLSAVRGAAKRHLLML
jgi:hypothetical protein